MKASWLHRLAIASLSALLLCALGTVAHSATDPSGFGAPPSGAYPILYNDHTVYARPDILKRNRVLAAIVKDGHIYVPLRSMFEQMGATVSVSSDGKTFTAVKPGVSISVTLGVHQVVINGETRPLDVPPVLYHGILLVPVRVLSEAMGAYVKWVPGRQIVVVRYITPTPMPSAEPTAVPTEEPTAAPTPTASPTPVPAPTGYNGFVQVAAWMPQNHNEFVAGGYCPSSYLAAGVYKFKHSPIAVKVNYGQEFYLTSSQIADAYGNHYTQFATIDGGTAITPVFLAQQRTLDVRLEYQVAKPLVYVGLGYLSTGNNYGYPRLTGIGAGVEKLPNLTPGLSLYGSAFYYPNASGNYTVTSSTSSNFGRSYHQQYQITKLDIGVALVLRHFPVYLYGGFSADQYAAKENAPIGQTHNGPYIGLGVKF